jgi:hypothetical protein
MLRRRFAVIKLWPHLKTAEDECIARLKITAKSLGLECLEVDSFGRLLDPPHAQLTQDDVDFVLSLHFETPKRYDIFSFVALWNPLQFYHEWGYRRFTRNLLTHDDFLSCSSVWADDHVGRSLARDPLRAVPELQLYHSLSDPIYPPTIGEGKLFYAGINWEKVGKSPQRHAKLLDLLDETGDLRIYGPKLFGGVDVWAGFKSYSGPVPFDGVSMVRLINKAGISLVLSSEAHRQSELMSSRLFESLAAGSVIICDENPFASRFFGETLLYIDTTLGADDAYGQVQSHLHWIRSNPEKAKNLAKQAQEIFLSEFALNHSLEKIYRELPGRKQKLECLYKPRRPEEKISLICLMPEFKTDVLERHIASCLAQKNVSLRAILAMDSRDFEVFGPRVQARLNTLSIPITLETVDFFERNRDRRIKSTRRNGSILYEVINRFAQDDYFCVLCPKERMFSDHLSSLLRTLQDCEEDGAAWADILLSNKTNDKERLELSDPPQIQSTSPDELLGMGRFLFRTSALATDVEAVLPYLHRLPMQFLYGITKSTPSKRCTLVRDIPDDFRPEVLMTCGSEEREVIIDYSPSFFERERTQQIQTQQIPTSGFSIESLTPEQKTQLAVELAHSVPFPGLLKKIGFGFYRLWLRAMHRPNDGR